MFEVTKSDLAGRIGRLHTNHGTVETPAYVPVVHPVKQSVPPDAIRRMGFDMVITNAYITMKRHGQEAVRRGIHGIIGFDGPVMTDSGGYQVLEYGDIDVSPPAMAEFETAIMTDVAIPLDKPTGFGLSRRMAAGYVNHTLKVSKETLEAADDNGQIWVGPVQGGEHLDLVRRSARALVGHGFSMMALGSPVEFMESYEYARLASMIAAARSAIPSRIPLHLFGAGHPLTIPLAVALGCDTFDSASYILYAKQGRYITPDGTRHLDEIRVFPCSCMVCQSRTPDELRQEDGPARVDALALHNLHTIKLEVDTTRQAIHEGRLWEHVVKKARAHPRLFEALSVLRETPRLLSSGTPRFKEKAVFLFESIDQFRPEAGALRRTIRGFRTKKKILHIISEPEAKPAYLSARYRKIQDADDAVQVCVYNPHLGIIPVELTDMYPAAHHLDARIPRDPADYPTFAEAWGSFLKNNPFDEIRYDASDAFISHFVDGASATKAPYQK